MKQTGIKHTQQRSLYKVGTLLFGVVEEPYKVKRLLKEVLSQKQFSQLKNPTAKSFIYKILSKLANTTIAKKIALVIKKALSFISGLFPSIPSHITYLGLQIILFLALGLILYSLINTIIKRVSLSTSSQSWKHKRTSSLTYRDIEKQAYTYAHQNQFTEAIRNLYKALLLLLKAKNILDSRCKTNLELEELLKRKNIPSLLERIKKLNGIFEEKVYALKPASYKDYEFFHSLYAECKEEVSKIAG